MDALDLVTGSDSDLSDLSDDEGGDEYVFPGHEFQAEEADPDAENDNESPIASCTAKKTVHSYRWRKSSPPQVQGTFNHSLSDPNERELTAFQYFKMFLNDETIDLITNQTNLYSTKKTCSSINVSSDEISTFIGMHMLMGMINYPSYTSYWSRQLRCPQVANAMSQKRYEKIRRF